MLVSRPSAALFVIVIAACDGAGSSNGRSNQPDTGMTTVEDADAPEAEPFDARALDEHEDAQTSDAMPAAAVVRVGVPDAETNLYFEPLESDGPISIRMGGQGGTHALIAVQCEGFGNRVIHQITMKDLDGDGEVATLPLPRPRPIACNDEGVCKISPIFVLLGGLAAPEEWDGLHVEVSATVSNEDGLVASDTRTGYLTRD